MISRRSLVMGFAAAAAAPGKVLDTRVISQEPQYYSVPKMALLSDSHQMPAVEQSAAAGQAQESRA